MNTDDEIKRKIGDINKKWYGTSAKEHDEESVIRNFICPLIEGLGWNLTTDLRREVNNIDCVFYSNGIPYIGIEAKSFSFGPLDEGKRNVIFNRDRLLRKCREICVEYAMVSRYTETAIYRVEDGQRIALFNHPNEYIENLKGLETLGKPPAK